MTFCNYERQHARQHNIPASQIMFAEHYVNIRVMFVEYSCKCSLNVIL